VPKTRPAARNRAVTHRSGAGWPPRVGKRSGRLAVMTRLMLRQCASSGSMADLNILAGRPRQWLGLARLPGGFSASAPPFFFGLGGGVDLSAELRANKHTQATGRSCQHRWCTAWRSSVCPGSSQRHVRHGTSPRTLSAFRLLPRRSDSSAERMGCDAQRL
jgi:hypothetical protein